MTDQNVCDAHRLFDDSERPNWSVIWHTGGTHIMLTDTSGDPDDAEAPTIIVRGRGSKALAARIAAGLNSEET